MENQRTFSRTNKRINKDYRALFLSQNNHVTGKPHRPHPSSHILVKSHDMTPLRLSKAQPLQATATKQATTPVLRKFISEVTVT
jgi:hypothetical protein